jgi:hypothetical protein
VTAMEVNIAGASRRLFVSYARKDREALQSLLDGLERLNVTLWVDQRLRGGRPWWDEILTQIRGCEGMLVPISPSLLNSEACTSERTYGGALGKPILPVLIKAVPMVALPKDLAMLQMVDYTTPGVEAAFDLAAAINVLPATPPLPDPLPDPPDVPKSYQYDLADRVHAPSLSLEEQLGLVAQLRGFIHDPEERDWAVELVKAMQVRRDLYKAVDRDISDALDRMPREEPVTPREEPVTPKEEAPFVPAGWYDDPSGRHQLRWFDRDWTPWAADGGVVVEDPLS